MRSFVHFLDEKVLHLRPDQERDQTNFVDQNVRNTVLDYLLDHVHTNPFSFENGDLVSKTHRKFSVHTTTGKRRFRMYPLWRAFSKSSVFAVHTTTGKRRFEKLRFRRPHYNRKTAFSNVSTLESVFEKLRLFSVTEEAGLVWTKGRSLLG